jgi:periplasmic divalent cation tolerance protein
MILNSNGSVITVTLMTAPSQTVATDIANRLVEQKLAACVNILPQITSVYRWDGKVNVDSELLLVVKSDSSPLHLQALRDAVLEIHPYDTPEIIHLPVSAGLDKYIEWVKKETKTKDS